MVSGLEIKSNWFMKSLTTSLAVAESVAASMGRLIDLQPRLIAKFKISSESEETKVSTTVFDSNALRIAISKSGVPEISCRFLAITDLDPDLAGTRARTFIVCLLLFCEEASNALFE